MQVFFLYYVFKMHDIHVMRVKYHGVNQTPWSKTLFWLHGRRHAHIMGSVKVESLKNILNLPHNPLPNPKRTTKMWDLLVKFSSWIEDSQLKDNLEVNENVAYHVNGKNDEKIHITQTLTPQMEIPLELVTTCIRTCEDEEEGGYHYHGVTWP